MLTYVHDADNWAIIGMVEEHFSLIWTDRFVDKGDVTLKVPITDKNRQLLQIGRFLTINKSDRMMLIHTIEYEQDKNNDRMVMVVKGSSLEYVFENRIARDEIGGSYKYPNWYTHAMNPKELVYYLMEHAIKTPPPSMSDSNKVPQTVHRAYPDNGFMRLIAEGNVPKFPEPVNYWLKPDTMARYIREICMGYNMGYAVLPKKVGTSDPGHWNVWLLVYSGNDRTLNQDPNPPTGDPMPVCVFSESLENVGDTRSLHSEEGWYNAANVWCDYGGLVMALPIDGEVQGWRRRNLLVDANSYVSQDWIDNSDPSGNRLNPAHQADLVAALKQAGTEALIANRKTNIFDIDIDDSQKYIYGVDYDLGDLVELHRPMDDALKQSRVTAVTFSSDENGEKIYPTLEDYFYVMESTWRYYPEHLTWSIAPGEWASS